MAKKYEDVWDEHFVSAGQSCLARVQLLGSSGHTLLFPFALVLIQEKLF